MGPGEGWARSASPNSPAAASGPGSWGMGGNCSSYSSAGATLPGEQGQGPGLSWRAEVRPLQWDWLETKNIRRGLNFQKEGGGISPAEEHESAHCEKVQGSPERGGYGSTLSQMEHGNPQREGGGWPIAGGAAGRLTKVSLALLKAFMSCGARNLNWATTQPLAPGRALRGVGTGTAAVLVSTVVISISTSVQPTGKSVLMEGETNEGMDSVRS